MIYNRPASWWRRRKRRPLPPSSLPNWTRGQEGSSFSTAKADKGDSLLAEEKEEKVTFFTPSSLSFVKAYKADGFLMDKKEEAPHLLYFLQQIGRSRQGKSPFSSSAEADKANQALSRGTIWKASSQRRRRQRSPSSFSFSGSDAVDNLTRCTRQAAP